MAAKIIFVTGGARSGKSSFAESCAKDSAGEASVLYLATAQAFDDEMRERIARHHQQRPIHWRTIEVPRLLLSACEDTLDEAGAVLLDCLTLLVTNVLLEEGADTRSVEELEEEVMTELSALIAACRARELTLVLVTNEVGSGIVPEYPLGRVFRDVAGRVNQRIAAQADEAWLLVSGLPLRLKGL